MSEEAVSVASAPRSPVRVGLVVEVEISVDELDEELVVGAKEIEPPIGS